MENWDFISKPNNCKGCPIAKNMPVGFRVANICQNSVMGWIIQYRLDDLGRTICKVRRNGKHPC